MSTYINNSNQEVKDNDEPLPAPHSAWRHPAQSWTDFIASYLVSFLLPIHKLVNYSAHEPNDVLLKARSGGFATKALQMGMAACSKAWSKAAECEIAHVILQVPRNPNTLKEWGFDGPSSKISTESGIDVHLFFPMSILEGIESGVTIQEETEHGFRKVVLENLLILPPDIPLTIFFHGGAFVLGEACSGWVTLVPAMLEKHNKPLILASVEYRLAPEFPFPAAPEDALTVVSYILDQCPDRKIHLSGLSAGGSLSAIVAMECVRKYPGRIASAFIGTAYIDPKGDSLSYYMNQKSSHLPTTGFLRWGWQAYLELLPSKDKKPESEATLSRSEILGIDSNRTTWNECKWKGSSMERLITPQIDLPMGLNGPDAPQFILSTNRADPLMDECLDLLAKLKEHSAKVTHFDHIGTHWLGTEIDKALLGEVADAWGKALFDS
ncbi:hypothetical protein MPSEU_000455000 [Mayamaea pseudoterrestris]|nr:hypothetical protein MPSEU_000455000 [Mayamaea pseudoterrestris]